jgi:putative FmdB family regulatory protein
MPVYDYDCSDCGVFEVVRRIAERDDPAACPQCGAPAARVTIAARALAAQLRPTTVRVMPAATACLIEVVASAAVSPRLPRARVRRLSRSISFFGLRGSARRVPLFRRERIKVVEPARVQLCCARTLLA